MSAIVMEFFEMTGLGLWDAGNNVYCYFSLNKNKKTRLIYLGKKREDKAREYSQNYKKLLEIVEKMTIINSTVISSY